MNDPDIEEIGMLLQNSTPEFRKRFVQEAMANFESNMELFADLLTLEAEINEPHTQS